MSERLDSFWEEVQENELTEQRKVLKTLKRRYWSLRNQAATKGIQVDPAVPMEIENLEKEIEKAEADLLSLDAEKERQSQQEIEKAMAEWLSRNAAKQKRFQSGIDQYEKALKQERPNDWFSFMNREEEKKALRTPSTYRYLFAVNGPAGYGKSVLLSQVAAEYRDEGWPVARVDLSDRYTPRTLLQTLIAKVKSGEQQPTELLLLHQEEDDLRLELVRVVISKGGLCLLLDSAEQAPKDIATYLRDTLIADLHDKLQKRVNFRCIVAGRHIKKAWAPEDTTEGTVLVELSAFDVPVIEDELNNIYKKSDGKCVDKPEDVRRLARRVWHLCGGHPKLIAEALRWVEKNFSARRNDFKRELIKASLQEVCETMQREAPEEFREVFSQVAVLRSFDFGLVEDFGRKVGFVPGHFRDGETVTTPLTKRGLVVFDNSIKMYRDAIYRRILLERAHQTKQDLVSLHTKALEIYESRLELCDTCLDYDGDYLTVEALYHSICLGQSKRELKANFEACLSHLAEHYKPERAIGVAQSIQDKLRRDYELQEELCLLTEQDDFIELELLPILDAFIAEREREYKNRSEGQKSDG